MFVVAFPEWKTQFGSQWPVGRYAYVRAYQKLNEVSHLRCDRIILIVIASKTIRGGSQPAIHPNIYSRAAPYLASSFHTCAQFIGCIVC